MEKSCLNKSIERLKQFEITNFKSWYNDKLIFFNDYPYLDCWKTLPHIAEKVIDVPLKKVIGTTHINYSDRTWLENLGSLGRFSPYYTKEYSTNYLLSKDRNITNSYIKLGDNYFISEGNHRTHSAKFLGFESIKGKVTEYLFDNELFNTIAEYKKEKIEFNSEYVYRKSSWSFIISDFSFYINDFEILKAFVHLYKNTKPNWFEHNKFKLEKKINFSNHRNFKHINSLEDLNIIVRCLSGLKYKKLITDYSTILKQFRVVI